MVKIGNIVNFGKGKFGLTHFNVLMDIDDVDNDLPTLLVGYYEIKEQFDLNFFDKKIIGNLYWTFTKAEDRYHYNRDLSSFIDICEANLKSKINYTFINPLELKLSQIKRLITHLKSTQGLVVSDGDMIYVWVEDKTLGFHTDMLELYGVEKERALRFLIENNYQILTDDEIKTIQGNVGELEIDSSELLYIKENF